MQIEEIEISKIKEYEQNNKIHGDEQINELVANFKKVGIIDPIFVDENNIILQGHKRLAALKKFGQKKAKIIRVSGLTDSQKSIYRIASNKLTHNSEWDFQNIKLELSEFEDIELKELGLDFELVGVDELEEDKEIIEDEAPEIQKNTISKLGDLWLLGDHRLLCGDSCIKEDVELLMDGQKATMMMTDPPYGDDWVKKARDMQKHGYGHSHAGLCGSIKSDELKEDQLENFLCSFLEQAINISLGKFPIYIWHGAKRIIFETALLKTGFHVHQLIVWVKPSFVIGRLHYHLRCEWAVHGWINNITGTCPFYGERNQSDVWEIGRENDKIHPTQKPVELFSIPIKNHTKKNEIVYEPFSGSGTQIIAAEQLNRKCYAMELEPLYVDVAIRRWQNLTGKEAIREYDGKKFNSLEGL